MSLDPAGKSACATPANHQLRSVNGQIEYLLRSTTGTDASWWSGLQSAEK
jgi:hypothetical protein